MESGDKEKKLYIKKADVILMAVCLLAALFLAGGLLFGYERGELLQVSYDGDVILTARLDESMYYLITYKENRAVLVKNKEMPDIPAQESYNLVYVAGKRRRWRRQIVEIRFACTINPSPAGERVLSVCRIGWWRRLLEENKMKG